MFCRLAATVLAGALVMVPPVRAGLERGLRTRSEAATERHSGDDVAVDLDGDGPPQGDALLPKWGPAGAAGDGHANEVAAFGFGPRTGFFPSGEPRELVLSFDDGPDLKFTPLVLDELDRRGLKAIFFVTGHRVIGDRSEDLARRELLGRIAAHGHMVANHTMTHRNLCQFPEDAAAEIDQNAEVIAQATGVRPLLFRAPYGARCRTLEAELAARQLVSLGWNLDPQDWKDPSSDGILTYLEARLSRLKGRGILLLHDTHPASVFALGPLLDWIARDNRAAVQEGRPPIALRDYAVFLPPKPVPRTGIATVVVAVFDNLMSALTPRVSSPLVPAQR